MAAARALGSRQLGYALRRRIAALDPDKDHEEVARLTLEVLYGDPIAVHAGLLLGFSRQVAVPAIARVIYRGGGGETVHNVARRNDETLALFGAFLKWGPSSPEGRAAIARMERIHAAFPITDEQKRYTLATLIFEPGRIARHLGVDQLTAGQQEAIWRFWLSVAEQMPLGGLPATREELRRWMLDYERDHWRYTSDGRQVVEHFFEDWGTRWFPRPARPLGRQVLLAMMDDALRAALHLEAPSKELERLVRASARASSPLVLVRPFRSDRSWLDYFGRHRAARSAARNGPRGSSTAGQLRSAGPARTSPAGGPWVPGQQVGAVGVDSRREGRVERQVAVPVKGGEVGQVAPSDDVAAEAVLEWLGVALRASEGAEGLVVRGHQGGDFAPRKFRCTTTERL